MRIIVNLIVFFICFSGLAQQDYKGKVLDAQTKKPLPYVNIGVFGKGIGTVSDEEGIFHLPIDSSRLADTDIVQFSSMGYENIKIAVQNLDMVYNEYPEVLMKPKNVTLNEVIVTNKGAFPVSENIGYQNYGEKVFGYWKEDSALGGELATKIRVKKGHRKLNTLFFTVLANPSDSVLVRVNFYDLGKRKINPGRNLNDSNSNILKTIYPNTKLAVVDLTPYAIEVKNDFIVSLELLHVYGDKPLGVALTASNIDTSYSIRKDASLGGWELIDNKVMAYYLNSTYYSDSKKAESKVIQSQKSKQNISGFIFSSRRPLANIKVTNLSTNEENFSTDKGRYQVLGEKDDIISFEGQGFEKKTIILLEKTNININMVRK